MTTLCGRPESGFRDGDDPRFDEPAGISASADTLFVADRNNHAVRIVDPKTGRTETLTGC